MGPFVNNYRSFAIVPDGSKEGWPESDEGDEGRDRFIEWLDTQRYDDGSPRQRWVEVQFGDDDEETKVCRDSDHRPRVAAQGKG